MAISISVCATIHWTNSSISSVKQCKFVGQSVRALPIRIITVGKKRSPGVQWLVDGYVDKLKIYCPVDDVLIRSNPKNTRDVKAQIDDEDMAVMNHIRSDDRELQGYYGHGRQMRERANISVIFNGLESSNCSSCACGTTLQVMDYSARTELPSLDVLII